jgi:hypothetical protein
MMRSCCPIILVLIVGGCASKQQGRLSAQQGYDDASTASLVFTPPVALDDEPLELARDDRTPRAFVGYDEVSTSYFHIWTDDRQTNDGTDRYVRRSRIEKVGVSYR